MIFARLVKTASFAALAAAGVTRQRLQARERRALENHPAEGTIVTVNGLKLHALVRGEGPDLVLIHGASGSSRDMSHGFIDRLSQEFRVIAFDRPGFGYSDALPDAGISLKAQAAHLVAGAEALGVHAPILLGHSYGGTVAMAWALDHPARALLTLGAPVLPWEGALDRWYRATAQPVRRKILVPLASAWVPSSYLSRTIAAVFSPNPVPDGYVEHLGKDLTLRASQLSINVMQINALLDELKVISQEWTKLNLPFELLHGDQDSVVPAELHALPLAQILPHARLTILEGIGHMPHHVAPEAVLAALRRLNKTAPL